MPIASRMPRTATAISNSMRVNPEDRCIVSPVGFKGLPSRLQARCRTANAKAAKPSQALGGAAHAGARRELGKATQHSPAGAASGAVECVAAGLCGGRGAGAALLRGLREGHLEAHRID